MDFCSELKQRVSSTDLQEMGVSYKECLKNHAANLGGHALDGCGEFMANPNSTLKCAACGCHRNFHRRDNLNFVPTPTSSPSATESPPLQPIASPVPCSYYTAAPHVLLSLSSSGFPGPSENSSRGGVRKRTRTKFTGDQKMKMRGFAEKAGWKINGCDEKLVKEFCNEVGIERSVLKVWMHNNKYSLRDNTTPLSLTNNGVHTALSPYASSSS